MKNKTVFALGIALMFLGTTTIATAYHIDYDSNGGNPADEWATSTIGLFTICETQGLTDKVNPNAVANKGQGGLCYASSQDFATCTGTPPANQVCVNNKTAEKEKKPSQKGDFADWGFIEPTCIVGDCDNKTEGGSDNWFIRIGSNTRSCNGVWEQTFVYKEVIAYWGGTAPNNQTGASGHVTFFVNDPDSAGHYDRHKELQVNETALGFINDTKSFGDNDPITDDPCTGNGSSWGLCNNTVASIVADLNYGRVGVC